MSNAQIDFDRCGESESIKKGQFGFFFSSKCVHFSRFYDYYFRWREQSFIFSA